VHVWEVESGRLTHTLSSHSDFIETVGFSPDGRRIVSASRDRSLMVWDSTTGRRIATIIAFNSVDHVVIGDDGFFTATPGAIANLGLARGSEVIPVPDDYRAAFTRERNFDAIAAALK
jgi:WD40 repeat protein